MRAERLLTVLLLVPYLPAAGQDVRLSQPALVRQTIADTVTVEITYSRPTARGRALFGGIVDWDETWNPGADSATAIVLSHDLLVAGNRLPAGRYSVWMIPRERQAWTVIFSRRAPVYHVPYPGERHDALRFDVHPSQGEHMEALAFYVPEVRPDGAMLVFHWGTIVLELPLRVPR